MVKMEGSKFESENFSCLVGCCLYQVNTYLDQGQRIGYSPQEYYEKIANLGTTLVKQDLVYVKVCNNDNNHEKYLILIDI